MSKGIIVVGGTEEEHYNLLGKDRLHPIINVYPEENDIYNYLYFSVHYMVFFKNI